MSTIRRATDADLPALARLRWQWVAELGGAVGTLDEYEEAFVEWAQKHSATHHAVIAESSGVVVGMAWVALAPRLPSPGLPDRFNAEVQSVYVTPEARGTGVGSRLIEAAVTMARDAERIVVHSSADAVERYRRAGFRPSPFLLER